MPRRFSGRSENAAQQQRQPAGSPTGSRLQRILPQFRRQDIDAALRDSNGHVSTAVEKLLHFPAMVSADGRVKIETGPGQQAVVRSSLDGSPVSNTRLWAPASARPKIQRRGGPEGLEAEYSSQRSVMSRVHIASEERALSHSQERGSVSPQPHFVMQRMQAVVKLAERRNNSPVVTPISKFRDVDSNAPLMMRLTRGTAMESLRSPESDAPERRRHASPERGLRTPGRRLFRRRAEMDMEVGGQMQRKTSSKELIPSAAAVPKLRAMLSYGDDQEDFRTVQELLGQGGDVRRFESNRTTISRYRRISTSASPPPVAQFSARPVRKSKSARPMLELMDTERAGPAVGSSQAPPAARQEARPATAGEERRSQELRHPARPHSASLYGSFTRGASPEAPGGPRVARLIRKATPAADGTTSRSASPHRSQGGTSQALGATASRPARRPWTAESTREVRRGGQEAGGTSSPGTRRAMVWKGTWQWNPGEAAGAGGAASSARSNGKRAPLSGGSPQQQSRERSPPSARPYAGMMTLPRLGTESSDGTVQQGVDCEEVALQTGAQDREAQGLLSILVTSHESVEGLSLFDGLREAVRQSSGREEAIKVEQRERDDFYYSFCATESRPLLLMHVPGTQGILRHFIQGTAIADTLVIVLPSRDSLLRDDSWLFERALIARGMGINKLTFAVVEDGPLLQTQFQKTMDFVKAQLAEHAVTCTMPATYIPIVKASGDASQGLQSPIWYRGKTLLQALEGLQASSPSATPRSEAQLRVLLLDAHKDEENVSLVGRVMQGSIEPGTKCSLHPWRRSLQIVKVCDVHTGAEIDRTNANDCAKIIVAPLANEDSNREDGNSLVDPQALVPARISSSALWGAQNVEADRWLIDLRVVDLNGSKMERVEITKDFRGTLYFGCQVVAVNIINFVEAFDLETQKRVSAPRTAKPGSLTQCTVALREPAALDIFSGGRLGRFVLRRMGMTLGVGRIIKPADGR